MATKPVKYMKNPTYVDAMLVTPSSVSDVAKWVGGMVVDDPIHGKSIQLPKVKPPYNRARVGQYVVQYPNGVLTVSEPDVFDEVYVPA